MFRAGVGLEELAANHLCAAGVGENAEELLTSFIRDNQAHELASHSIPPGRRGRLSSRWARAQGLAKGQLIVGRHQLHRLIGQGGGGKQGLAQL
jgi:hypothetical protein